MSAPAGSRGSALVAAVIMLVLLTAMGIAVLSISRTEILVSRADVHAKQAFFLAETALEEGRMALLASVGGAPFDAALAAAAGNHQFDLDVAALRVTHDAEGIPIDFTGAGDDVPLRALAGIEIDAGSDGWRAAFLTNDPTEYASTVDTNDRVMITGVGVGPNRSVEIVQAIIEHRFLIPPAPPATVTLLGPDPDYEGGNSVAKTYTGTDCNGAGEPGLFVPAVGVFGSDARDSVLDGYGAGATYSSGTANGSDAIADLSDPTHPLVTVGVDPTWTDCFALRDLMAGLRANADIVCGVGSCVPPPASPTRVVFVEGNYTAQAGQGLLAVTGRLLASGAWNWDGLVLVVGTGEFQRQGGGNGTIQGGIVVASISGPDGVLFTGDDCTAAPDGFDSPAMATEGGGSSLATYCKASLDALHLPLPYEVVDFVQR